MSSTGHTFARDGLDFDDLDWERRKYRGFLVYCATKLANVLFTRELARRSTTRRSRPTRCIPASSAPTSPARATWASSIGLGMLAARPFAISSARGAHTSVYLASSPDVDGITGQYFYKCKVVKPSNAALDDAAAARLWDVSAEMTGLS